MFLGGYAAMRAVTPVGQSADEDGFEAVGFIFWWRGLNRAELVSLIFFRLRWKVTATSRRHAKISEEADE